MASGFRLTVRISAFAASKASNVSSVKPSPQMRLTAFIIAWFRNRVGAAR